MMERERMKDINIYQIDRGICKVRTRMLNLPWPFEVVDSDLEKFYQLLQQQLGVLYKDRRTEEANC